MKALAILALMLALLLSGVAMAYALGAAAVLSFIITDSTRYLAAIPQRIFTQVDVFAIMAMPLFVLAGEFMNRAGVTRALIDFSMLIFGRLRGGLGHVNIMTSVFFAGISGSASADIAALTKTFVPQMERHGYDRYYAGALTASASVIAPIIPPSIILIMYGAITATDVAALFAGGVVPGFLLALSLFITNAIIARNEGHPGGAGAELPPLWPTLRRAIPALLLPVIIIGGIVFGITTPIEAGALACVAALTIGLVFREIKWPDITESISRTAQLTGSIFMIIAAASLLSYLIVLHKIPDELVEIVTSLGLEGIWFVLLIMLLFIIMGMTFDFMLGLLVVAPLLVPIAIAQGVHPVALGVLICVNIAIGLILPPMGEGLLMVSTITGQKYWALCMRALPFVAAELVTLLVITVFPELILALPRAMGLL